MSVESAVAAVKAAGGVARTTTLVRSGVRKPDLTHAVRQGDLLRPRQGIYAVSTTPVSILEALSHRGVAACVTAGRELGLWILDDGDHEPTHTWVREEHHPTRMAIMPEPDSGACCVFHRDLPVDETSLTTVGILHCLVQILACRGEECFFAALESALRQGLITAEERATLRTRVPRTARWLVDFARTDADSGLESLLRLRLHRRGLTLTTQVSIPGVGDVDFVIGDCLILEADGGTHDGPGRHTDRVRDAVAMVLGFVTLRFDYAMIVHDWQLVEDAILAAVNRDLHRSRAGRTW